MIGWLVTPPSFPAAVLPRSTHGSEHIAAQDPCADIEKTTLRKIIVRTFRTALLLKQHLLKRACRKYPLMQRHSAYPHRIIDVLFWARAEAIGRHAEAAYHELAFGNVHERPTSVTIAMRPNRNTAPESRDKPASVSRCHSPRRAHRPDAWSGRPGRTRSPGNSAR